MSSSSQQKGNKKKNIVTLADCSHFGFLTIFSKWQLLHMLEAMRKGLSVRADLIKGNRVEKEEIKEGND